LRWVPPKTRKEDFRIGKIFPKKGLFGGFFGKKGPNFWGPGGGIWAKMLRFTPLGKGGEPSRGGNPRGKEFLGGGGYLFLAQKVFPHTEYWGELSPHGGNMAKKDFCAEQTPSSTRAPTQQRTGSPPLLSRGSSSPPSRLGASAAPEERSLLPSNAHPFGGTK